MRMSSCDKLNIAICHGAFLASGAFILLKQLPAFSGNCFALSVNQCIQSKKRKYFYLNQYFHIKKYALVLISVVS